MYSQQRGRGVTHQAESQDCGGGRGGDHEEVNIISHVIMSEIMIVKGVGSEEDRPGQTEGGD